MKFFNSQFMLGAVLAAFVWPPEFDTKTHFLQFCLI